MQKIPFFVYLDTIMVKKKNKIILIFGFSGSGKSSIADLLGKKFRLRVVHPSSILRNLLEKKSVDIKRTRAGKGFWESKKGMALYKSRLNSARPLDMVSDQILLREIKKGNLVMDSWTMPWLSKTGVKIFLSAPLNIRAGRVARRSKVPEKEARIAIQTRDQENRKLFRRLYGFDIKKDTHVFDYIINTPHLNKQQVFQKALEFVQTKK